MNSQGCSLVAQVVHFLAKRSCFSLPCVVHLSVLVFLHIFFATPGVSGEQIALTPQERQLVETEGELRLCVDPDWLPFETIDEHGMYRGIAADLLHLISQRTGIRFQLVPTTNWEESVEFSKQGKCQALAFLNETPKRRQWLAFSDPLFTDINVFITREEHPYIADPNELVLESLVLPRGTSIEEYVRSTYPNLHIITVETETEALQYVSDKKADMTLRSLFVAAYTIKMQGWFNLKISGQLPQYSDKLRVGIIKEKSAILPVVNKAIATINGQDRGAIINRHISINVQTGTDRNLIHKILIGVGIAAVIVFAFILQLKWHNRELLKIARTDALTGLGNRSKLNVALDHEFARAKRTFRPFALILFDLDYFKKLNDTQGHLAGDGVLQEFAVLLQNGVRKIDLVGRWGGEEFLVICPDTDGEHAQIVAERIVAKTAENAFSSGQQQTVSAGVAVYQESDTLDTLLSRTDSALYQAKNSGRNRAVLLHAADSSSIG